MARHTCRSPEDTKADMEAEVSTGRAGEPSHFVTRGACEVCGSRHHDVLLTRDYSDPCVLQFLDEYYARRIPHGILAGADYRIVRCRDCGFVWQAQVLDGAGMCRLYDEWIDADESLRKKTMAPFSLYARYAAEMMAVYALTRKRPCDTRVLDFGMGWGYWCLSAKAFGYRVTGAELSARRATHARQMGIEVIAPGAVTACGPFDYVNLWGVLEHVLNPGELLDALAKALAPRGVMFVQVPDVQPAIARYRAPDWRAQKDSLHPLEHINGFSRSSLLDLAARHGLYPVRSCTVTEFARHPDSVRAAVLVRRVLDAFRPSADLRIYFRRRA
jgi:2-polyprenyl-3-methyl-5-hydroxy-6-metoxy-1,4-benzoquinol methylase